MNAYPEQCDGALTQAVDIARRLAMETMGSTAFFIVVEDIAGHAHYGACNKTALKGPG